MAEVVNKSQQVFISGQRPVSTYSRVVGLIAQTPEGSGLVDCHITPPLGNRLWLLGGSISWFGYHPAITCAGWIRIYYGQGIVTTYAQMAATWKEVILMYGFFQGSFYALGDKGSLPYSCSKLFEGDALRFGLGIRNAKVDNYFHVIALFTIAEG